jgi:predicted O-methyltransferase YrrM/glycosyltransferase involved in cell wall biosynthesis
MRASLIVPRLKMGDNLDPAGRSVVEQARYLRRRGDEVRIYTVARPVAPPDDALPAGLAALVHWVPDDISEAETAAGLDAHLAASDLAIYHVTGSHSLLNAVKMHTRGVVVVCGHEGADAALLRLAPYADLVIAAHARQASALRAVCEPERVHLLPPVVDLEQFTPGLPDPETALRLGLAGKQVICVAAASEKAQTLLAEALASLQKSFPTAVLVTAGPSSGERAVLYRLSQIVIAPAQGEQAEFHMLEAMACARPVVAVHPDNDETGGEPSPVAAAALTVPAQPAALADALTRLLRDDDFYGDLVQRGLHMAQNHSVAQYWREWGRLLAQAAAWLPMPNQIAQPPDAPLSRGANDLPSQRQARLPEVTGPLADAITQLKQAANVMLRNYRVRSTLPIAGPAIAWARRVLTSHLREPYLDPTLQRQEAFNWQASLALEEIARQLAAQEERLAQTAAELEHQRNELRARVEHLHEQPLRPPAAVAAITADTAALGFGMASEPLTGSLLRTLAASKPGGRFLELGTGTGLSTAWLLDGMDGGSSLLTLDNDATAQAIARRHLAHDRRVTWHIEDGGDFLTALQDGDATFDFIFADTWPGKYTHLEIALSLLAPGALYVVDDMLPQPNWPVDHPPKVAALIAALEEHPGLHMTKLNWATGIIIAAKKPNG